MAMAMAMATDITYVDAVRFVESEAGARAFNFQDEMETLPLVKAAGRVSGRTYTSPESTPHFDTSAMDGYVLNSEATRNASVESPAIFCVKGMIAAGDEPMSISGEPNSWGEYPCVEIMTGARFPEGVGGEPFDCCVRVEDTTIAVENGSCKAQRIKITQPVKFQQNRRLAGGDFAEGDLIIQKGSTVQTNHIMALASVGYTDISVYRKPRVAIYSTGSELAAKEPNDIYRHKIRDVNGPYCSSMLETWGVEADFLGVIGDDAAEVSRKIEPHVDRQCRRYDLIITTGAVSAGKLDLVRAGIESLRASVIFHGVSMRPGHPALFAAIPGLCGESPGVPFFGLPGNPVASAAGLRFLVLPYLWRLQSQKPELPLKATFSGTDKTDRSRKNVDTVCDKISVTFPPDKDVYRPGIFGASLQQKLEVKLIMDHSPGKMKPFLCANCWIHIGRKEVELKEGDTVEIFPVN